MLKGLPTGVPRSKRPGAKIPKEYLSRICGNQFRSYCQDRNLLVMFENLTRMATDLDIPSKGQVDINTLDFLSNHRRKSMSGYGPVELIGEPTCVFYHVPFIRPRTGPMTEEILVKAGRVYKLSGPTSAARQSTSADTLARSNKSANERNHV